MKIAFMSDVHGVPSALATALSAADSLGFDRLVLLGDLLYHGPRNGVPNFYDPVEVAKMLNARKDRIVAALRDEVEHGDLDSMARLRAMKTSL